MKLGKIERADGSVEVEISDPGEGGKQVVVPTRERRGERLKSSMLAVEERDGSERKRFKIDEEPDGSDCGEEAFDGISKGEKTAINEGGDILCEEGVVLEESEEEAKSKGVTSQLIEEREIEVLNVEKSIRHNEDIVLGRVMGEFRQQGVEREEDRVVGSSMWAAVRQVEEKKMGIQDPGEDVRRDEDVVLGKKEEGNRLRDTEEVGQQGVEDKGTKKRDKERSKVRDGQETSEMLGSLTKKGGQRCPQHIEMSLQVAKKELIKERPCRSSTKNSRNCVDITSVQRSVEWECQGYMPTIKRRSTSSGSSLSEGMVNGNRDRGRTDSRTEGPLTSSTKVGKGVQSIRAQQNPWRRCRRTGEEVGKHQEVSQGSHDLQGHKELKINNVEWHPRIVVFQLTLYQPRSQKRLEITEFVDSKDLGGVGEEEVAESEGVGIDNDN